MASNEHRISHPHLGLEGRLAVVTGASAGIGRALALGYAQAGAEVVLVSRRREKLEEVQRSIKALGGTTHILCADLSRPDEIRAMGAGVREILADRKLALVLVNNAGFGFTKPALDVTDEDWDRLLDLQVKGTFFCAQALGRIMIERGYGKIINLSSTWSLSTEEGKSVYGLAKAAVSYLTKALSTEWAPLGVRVNAIAPTTTLSDNTRKSLADNPARAKRLLSRIKVGRFAEPEDLLGAALFLASAASDFVSGHTLFVDGGWSALG